MTDLRQQLDELEATGSEAIASAADLAELADIEATTIGKRSLVSEARRSLGQVDAAVRPELGRHINQVVETLQAKITAKRIRLETAGDAERLASEALDVTLPGRVPPRGSHHLITSALEEITDIFVSMGYDVASGPEAETSWYNFTALNIGPDHPTRAETDTIYLEYGEPGEVVLRTHTSPMQARYMQQHPPPVHVVVPGRVFRQEDVDPTHSPVFHQLEGLAVAEGITFAHLRGTLEAFAKRFFGAERRVRFLPSYFPFTEPSAEMLVSCFACDGSGCRVCTNEGWIEMLGCGMVHPAVFEAVGYDPSAVTGFAFGLGVDRFAQARHGINDLRHLFSGDIRVLRQFR
jgi:phenylalanyl-tRNA synthetase alpha chain